MKKETLTYEKIYVEIFPDFIIIDNDPKDLGNYDSCRIIITSKQLKEIFDKQKNMHP